MRPGEIYRHERFYTDPQTGELLKKYAVILALTRGGDVVFRLLTSRAHGRPETPPCFHGMPYPGYYLGVLGGTLGTKSWLDLRGQGDYDGECFRLGVRQDRIHLVMSLPKDLFRAVLDCAARADDTTDAQGRAMLDVLAALD